MQLEEPFTIHFWERVLSPTGLTIALVVFAIALIAVVAWMVFVIKSAPTNSRIEVSPTIPEEIAAINPYDPDISTEDQETLRSHYEGIADKRGVGLPIIVFAMLFATVIAPLTVGSASAYALTTELPIARESRDNAKVDSLISESSRIYGISLTEEDAVDLINGKSFSRAENAGGIEPVGATELTVSTSSGTFNATVLLVYYVDETLYQQDDGDGSSRSSVDLGEWQLRMLPSGLTIEDVAEMTMTERSTVNIVELPRV